MFFHIGGDFVVRDSDIVGIFDIDNCSTGQKTRNFFTINQKKGNVIDATDDLPKSFVVTSKDKINSVYISGVSSATLKKRVQKDDYSDQELE